LRGRGGPGFGRGGIGFGGVVLFRSAELRGDDLHGVEEPVAVGTSKEHGDLPGGATVELGHGDAAGVRDADLLAPRVGRRPVPGYQGLGLEAR
jgi:hypothetical protein